MELKDFKEIDKKHFEAFEHFDAKRYIEAVSIWEVIAKQGHADAQCSLGLCYKNGQGLEFPYRRCPRDGQG